MEDREEIDAILARARKTVADSRALVEQARLRLQETDRFLEEQGLSREQLEGMTFTDEQYELVNNELKKRGYQPIERDAAAYEHTPPDVRSTPPKEGETDDVVEDRRRKLGAFMQGYRI